MQNIPQSAPQESPPIVSTSYLGTGKGSPLVFRVLSSLELAVVVLTLGILLVFFGTLDQVHFGIHHTQQLYFRSWVALWTYPPQWAYADALRWLVVPLPGGYLLGLLMLLNLVFSQIVRFKRGWRHLGILLIHGGLVALLVGEAVTGLASKEHRMWIDVGEVQRYMEDYRRNELVLIEGLDNGNQHVTSIPERMLRAGEVFSLPRKGLSLRILHWFPNALITADPMAAREPGGLSASQGLGAERALRVFAMPKSYANESENITTALVEVFDSANLSLGTWLLSNVFGDSYPDQILRVGDSEIVLALRFERTYLPFAIQLREFRHERYPGTRIPRHFSSSVTLLDGTGAPRRDALISMNQPLREGGYTFYQASFANNDQASMLHVVRNPGRWLPYVASSLLTLGLLWQFGMHLLRFQGRRMDAVVSESSVDGSPRVRSSFPVVGVLLALVVVLLVLSRQFGQPRHPDEYSALLGNLPVQSEGRVKPLDTVARTGLMLIHGKYRVAYPDGSRRTALTWVLDLAVYPERADHVEVFRIDHPDLLGQMGLEAASRKHFSYSALEPYLPSLQRLFERIPAESQLRNDADRQLAKLRDALGVYAALKNTLPVAEPDRKVSDAFSNYFDTVGPGVSAIQSQQAGLPYDTEALQRYLDEAALYLRQLQSTGVAIVPPRDPSPEGAHWLTLGEALLRYSVDRWRSPVVDAWADWVDTARGGASPDLEQATSQLVSAYEAAFAGSWRLRGERIFNKVQPFLLSLQLYVGALLFVLLSWTRWPRSLGQAALVLLSSAWLLHTFGIVLRMILHERPPVTNLYSSAVFVGWGTVALAWMIERYWRNGIALMTGATVGFITLIIAHNLGAGTDTLEQMRAVLDSNFWLTTHVVVITLGYSAMFLAGTLAMAFVPVGLFTRRLDPTTIRSLTRSIYGVLCFALLFSFVGTVLGGIWADQSWGRFWGWDPKENGALIIVLWGSVILHARWGRLVQNRGFIALCVGCNIVTAWSWFGTNMLGVGLHSYGFIDSAFLWLVAYVMLNLIFMGAAVLPKVVWRSGPD